MKRILLTATSYPPSVGGAQLYLHLLARQMTAVSEFRFDVVTHWFEDRHDWLLGTTLRAPRTAQSYEIDEIPARSIALGLRDKWRILPYVAMYHLLNRFAVDRISEVLVDQLTAHREHYELVHNVRVGRENLSEASLKSARQLGVPFVFTPLHHPRWEGWLYRKYLELYRRADAVIALTKEERQTLIRLGVPPDRIAVTGMGPVLAKEAEGSRFRQLHRLDDHPLVLFLGQKFPYKGIKELLAAAERIWDGFPTARFVFIGPRTRWSKRLFEGARDDRILELGTVSLQEKTDALASCDLLCVPSSQESFGGVFTEAWMMESAVIGGPAPAISEVISDGEDGFVVNQDPRQISDRVTQLLRDEDLRSAMAERGKRKVLSSFTWDKITERTLRVYRKLTG